MFGSAIYSAYEINVDKEMITVQQSNHLKSIAVLMMLYLHLFNTLDYQGLFEPLIYIGSKPFVYYMSLFCDACVPIFAFVSGYGLYFKYQQNQSTYWKDNLSRLKKLYLNYWIILLIFPVGLGLFLNKEGYPGDLFTLVGNVSGLVTSYNGAWWFFTIYVLFVLTSSFWFRLLDKINVYLYWFGLLFLYLVCFYYRVYDPADHNNVALNWTETQLVLYGCTLFQFMLGAFTLRFSLTEKTKKVLSIIKNKSFLFVLGTVLLVGMHAAIPNFIVAPFTSFIFIFLFLQLKLNKPSGKLLDFFSPHATNLWLIHMFFYMVFFSKFIYSFNYIVLIFLVLLFCCIFSSLIVNKINKAVIKLYRF